MSGIVGIWNKDGEPVSREILAGMSKRIAHRGPDGEFVWTGGEVGIVFQRMMSTPESLTEVQPLTHPSGVVLVFDGRLDNREELLQQLTPMEGLSASAADPVFALAAYLQGKENFPRRLAGEFALALWDGPARRLILARDPMGSLPIYYSQAGEHFLFATEIKALLAHPAVRTEPNDAALAEYIYRAYDYSDESKTFFSSIHTVAPGQRVRVTPQRIATDRFWDFDTARQIRYQTDEEYVDAYKAQFFTAVKRRLRSAFPVSIMVSGGLDSSSIFCTALALKAESPMSFPELSGVSAVPAAPFPNESEYQEIIEGSCGVTLRKIPIQRTSALDEAARDIYWLEAPFAQWRDWKRIWEESHEYGSRAVLSGFFGDQILASPAYMVDLIYQLRGSALRRHFDGFCRFHADSPPSLHRHNLFHLLKFYAVPEWLQPVYRSMKKHLGRRDTGLGWYSDRFAALADPMRPQPHPRSGKGGSAHAHGLYHLARSTMHTQRTTMDSLWESHYHLHTSYPFRDRDLIAFLMAIPGEKVFLDGAVRGLHREAMRGILPEAIRTRTDKGHFTAIGQQGVFQDFLQVEKTLPTSMAARRGYLRPPEEIARELARNRALLEGDAPAITAWNLHDWIWLDTWLKVFFPLP
ncbi:MAG: asparagine synthase-related protein [Terriglobales bacterium]